MSIDPFASVKARLQADIGNILKNEVSKTVVDTAIDSAAEYIYGVYIPKEYERRYSFLEESSYESELIDNQTLFVKPIANPSESLLGTAYTDQGGTSFASWIENGDIYPLFGEAPYTESRQFIQETENKLASSSDVADALERGLRKRGYKII